MTRFNDYNHRKNLQQIKQEGIKRLSDERRDNFILASIFVVTTLLAIVIFA